MFLQTAFHSEKVISPPPVTYNREWKKCSCYALLAAFIGILSLNTGDELAGASEIRAWTNKGWSYF
jgi:hypothetical protein